MLEKNGINRDKDEINRKKRRDVEDTSTRARARERERERERITMKRNGTVI